MDPERSYFAHSTSRPDRAGWQPLRDHLLEVADLAHDRAAKFGAGEWGYVAGLLHDLGKYSAAFQARLEGASGQVDHSTAGALEAGKRWQGVARLIQFVVAGHHAGLANGGEEEQSRRSSLRDRLAAKQPFPTTRPINARSSCRRISRPRASHCTGTPKDAVTVQASRRRSSPACCSPV